MSGTEEFIGEGIISDNKRRVSFELYKLDGLYTKKVAQKVIGQEIKYVDKECPRGYLIKFPKRHNGTDYSHSVHLDTWDEVKKNGFAVAMVPVVDEDGEPIAAVPNQVRRTKSQKELVHA